MNAGCTHHETVDCAEREPIEHELEGGGRDRIEFGPGALVFEAAVVITMLLATILLVARPI